MNKPKKYTLPEVFNNTEIGFVFEFYSSKQTNFIVENLGHLTTKDVVTTNDANYEPSYGRTVLLKEYNGKKPRYSFKMARQRFDSAIPLMKEVLSWISETSDCTFDTLMRVNMSFDHHHLRTIRDIANMSTDMLILKIDEDFVYERFPEQKDSPYAMSARRLMPISEAIYTADLMKNVNYIIGTPKGKHCSINFEEYTRGILEFNYIGGIDYSEKQKEILELIEYYVIKTYQSLNEVEYSKSELSELKFMTEQFYKIHEAYYDHKKFQELFPEIMVAVDMRRDTQMLETFWPKIRNTLFDTVINNNLREGQFNYDADIGIYQLRGAEIDCTTIKGFDLVKCKITGIVNECNLIVCEVDKARVHNSKVVKKVEITNSYLQGVTIEEGNSLDNCFVENNYEIINCDIKNSIIKFAGLGKFARIDESTVVIDREDQLQQPAVGIEVEEIRDYRWFKNLLGKQPDKGFGNEYIKKSHI